MVRFVLLYYKIIYRYLGDDQSNKSEINQLSSILLEIIPESVYLNKQRHFPILFELILKHL